jgi:hypothetical protein
MCTVRAGLMPPLSLKSIARNDTSATTEYLLRKIHQFEKDAKKLGWTSGPKKFDIFELLLEGALQDRWEGNTSTVTTKTIDTFKESIERLVKVKTQRDYAFEIQKEHLRQFKKRLSITVIDFAKCLEDLNMYSKQLPGAGTGTILTDDELKRILYNAMPMSWKNEFRKSEDLSKFTFATLRDKMSIYEEIITPPKQSKDSSNNNNKNGQDNKNGNNRSNSSNNSNNFKRNGNNQNNNNNNR